MISRNSRLGAARAPVVLGVGVLAFAGVIVFLVVSALTPREAAVFEPSPIAPRPEPPEVGATDTITIAAYEGWQFFDFERGSVVLPPDTTGWDLMLRRFSVVPAGAAADLGLVDFAAPPAPPHEAWVETSFGRDTVNAAIDRWYTYSMFSHLLEPNGHSYAIRTSDGQTATIEFLSYYCPGVVGGCPTFRYTYGR